jgi:hypothetical protein
MGVCAAPQATPVFPKPDRQNGNPENVPYVEGASRDRATGCLAGQTIVIAKCNRFRPEMIGPSVDQHSAGDSSLVASLVLQELPCNH